MMNRILFVILAALLILSMFAAGCSSAGPCFAYWSPIEDIAIWANNSSPPEYFLYVVYGFSSCDGYSGSYEVTYVGNTSIEVDIFNGTCDADCPIDRYGTHNISLGSYFIIGVNYTVTVNNVTETFVAWV
jgi:hypothetical protein